MTRRHLEPGTPFCRHASTYVFDVALDNSVILLGTTIGLIVASETSPNAMGWLVEALLGDRLCRLFVLENELIL